MLGAGARKCNNAFQQLASRCQLSAACVRLQINFMTMIPATACRVLNILLRPSCTYRPTFQLPPGLEVVGGSGC